MIELMEDLVNRKLAIKKTDNQGYTTYKYHNKVFYNNLWDKSPALYECRGIVYSNGEIVQRPFRKIFNLRENGADVPEGEFITVRKVNGYMAAASWVGGKLLVSTTGTTTSDYAEMAREWLLPYSNYISKMPNHTFVFEIVDVSDPHIVEELPGVYLLGIRHKKTGDLINIVDVLENVAGEMGVKSPEYQIGVDKYNFTNMLKSCKHEGFVVWSADGRDMIVKAKSPYYLSKKALMRMGKKNIGKMFNESDAFKKRLDEEFYEVYDWILCTQTEDSYLELGEQGRRKLIEEYFYG